MAKVKIWLLVSYGCAFVKMDSGEMKQKCKRIMSELSEAESVPEFRHFRIWIEEEFLDVGIDGETNVVGLDPE